MSRLRTLLSPLHPQRLFARIRHLANLLGYLHLREWISRLHPRRITASGRWTRDFFAGIRRRRREPRLTVAVDVSALWEPLTGIGWYLYRLLTHLAERDDVRLRLYGARFIAKRGIPPSVIELPSGPAIEVVSHQVPDNLSLLHHRLCDILLRFRAYLIAADGNRLLFAPNYFLPPWFDRSRGSLVATVHDLSVERVPETMRESTRRDLKRHLVRTLGRAARVLTDSETVRDELIASGWVAGDRITAVHLGPGAVAGVPEAAHSLPQGTPERYALHVGTLEPRKDLPTLFAAWRELRRRGDETPPLVLCGGFGWKTDELRAAMADGLDEGWIFHFGYLADEQVAALYRGAEVAVLSSVYEGFGLPALEAMSLGTALVCSDIPVLREVAGDAALYAPPGRPEAWADRLAEVLADAELRAALGRRGRERAGRFDWWRTAEETVAVWRQAAEQ